MTACQVEGCSEAATRTIDLNQLQGRERPGSLSFDWAVCDFHSQALHSGQHFQLEDESQTIVIDDVPPRLITFKVHEDVSDPIVTFIVGHDGVETSRWTFQASRDFAGALIEASQDDKSELSKELKRNKGPGSD